MNDTGLPVEFTPEITQPIVYKTTREQCQSRIGLLVCEGCGGKLEPSETVDNAGSPTFWVGCNICSCFRGGVLRQYFDIARKLVNNDEMLPYPHLKREDTEDDPGGLDYWLNTQTAGLARNIVYIHQLLKEKFNAK